MPTIDDDTLLQACLIFTVYIWVLCEPFHEGLDSVVAAFMYGSFFARLDYLAVDHSGSHLLLNPFH